MSQKQKNQSITWKDYTAPVYEVGNLLVDSMVSNTDKMVSKAEKEYLQDLDTKSKLIKKVKVPYSTQPINDAIALLDRLYKEGLLGTNRKEAVDGHVGSKTRKALNISLLRLLIKLGLLDNSKGNADDGYIGKNSNAALAEALKQGYVLKNGVLTKKESAEEPKLQRKINNPFLHRGKTRRITNKLKEKLDEENTSLSDLIATRTGPAGALINATIRGKLGLDKQYTDIPLELIDVLSDQNQYIYDNWKDAMNYGLASTNSLLAQNLKKLIELQKQGVQPEDHWYNFLRSEDSINNEAQELYDLKVRTLKNEIENNKKSVANLQNKIALITKSGGLGKYLRSHPGEKVVIGGNFRWYKDRNRSRFPEGTPTGYASFDNPKHSDRYVGWAMHTPLGLVETTFGNNLQSYVYNPETNLIETAFSDAYNFNSFGSETKSNIAKLRSKVGNDATLGKTTISYRSALKPIVEGSTNYISDPEKFGKAPEKTSSIEDLAIKAGLKFYK